MIKTVQIGEKEITFSTAFAWTFVYRSQFGKDAAKVLIPAIRNVYDSEDQEASVWAIVGELGFTGIAEIAWASMYLVDKTYKTPEEWTNSFEEEFPIADVAELMLADIIKSTFATKKVSADPNARPPQKVAKK